MLTIGDPSLYILHICTCIKVRGANGWRARDSMLVFRHFAAVAARLGISLRREGRRNSYYPVSSIIPRGYIFI